MRFSDDIDQLVGPMKPIKYRLYPRRAMVYLAAMTMALTVLYMPLRVHAAEAIIAVAANFTLAAKQLQPLFEKESGHRLKLSFGSSGKLYAQILHGAPFDVFLSADTARPQKLLEHGHAMAGSEFIYAEGVLVLYSYEPKLAADKGAILKKGFQGKLAIANPKTAPYGAAAMAVLKKLNLADSLRGQLVVAENISQAYQFVASGNAKLGLIALSQLKATPELDSNIYWRVPASLHSPIQQQAVLLQHGNANPAAKAFLKFLRSPKAVKIIKSLGYMARLNPDRVF